MSTVRVASYPAGCQHGIATSSWDVNLYKADQARAGSIEVG